MKLEQRVMVGAEVGRDALSGDGVVEHSAQRYPIYRTCLNAEADDPASELIHHDEDPMRPQHDGFAPEQINTPQAVFHVPDERQPRRATGSRLRSIVFGEHPADHILVDLDAEGPPDDERNLRATEPWIALLEFKDHANEVLRWPFGAWRALPAR